jgi:hypothetical protein
MIGCHCHFPRRLVAGFVAFKDWTGANGYLFPIHVSYFIGHHALPSQRDRRMKEGTIEVVALAVTADGAAEDGTATCRLSRSARNASDSGIRRVNRSSAF